MKKLFSFGLALLCLFTLVACQKTSDSVKTQNTDSPSNLNIMMWGDYISEDLVKRFEKENNVKINFTYMSDNADAVNKLTAGGGAEFDLILTSDGYMKSLIEGKYLEKLDLSKLKNAKNLNQTYWYQDIRDYSIPYLMNYVYVVYDTARVSTPITSYNDLIKPEFAGKIGSIDGTRNLFSIALVALGYDPNTTNEKEIMEAYEWLKKFHANTVAYNNTQENILSGAISVMVTYDGNAAWAMKQLAEKGKNTLKVAEFTKDPVQLGIDLFVIPKGAQHQEMAYKFLDYILDAGVMAKKLKRISIFLSKRCSSSGSF